MRSRSHVDVAGAGPASEPDPNFGESDFAGWIAPHWIAICRLAARLAPANEIDDVTQETLIAAWRRHDDTTTRRHDSFDASRGAPKVPTTTYTASFVLKGCPTTLNPPDLPDPDATRTPLPASTYQLVSRR
jgi:hypothetical protein